MQWLRGCSVAVLVIVAIFFSACGKDDIHITQEDAVRIMKSNPDAIVLDVRTKDEFDKRHLPNALLVPIDNLRAGDFSKLPDKDATILIYCWTGRRAEDSAEILLEHGYKRVYEFGGLVDWTGEVEGTEVK